MESSEYLSFIPLLIYGLAIADLLSEWKRLFDKTQWYFPYLLTTIVLTELAIYNVFIYANLISELEGTSYLSYLKYILPPFLFLLMVSSFTPEKGDDTKEYFIRNMRIYLLLMAVFIASHFLFDFKEGRFVITLRTLMIVAVLLGAILRKVWMIYVLSLLWFILIFIRLNVIST
ncbi:MAG TPA: hypothetical protein DDY13_17410 [Cytophagales bacterium]|jgi:hypothetical protein|nr:hypothetical protein [Cytophagales bacterium]